MQDKRASGFTIIELLVVVTIIVVLLAMLTPAMDKAIYQAELTVCGTNLRGVALAAQSYAMDNDRYYPDRPGIGWSLDLTYPAQVDHRPMLRPYMSLNKMLNDPLAPEPVDLEDETIDDRGRKMVISASYPMWFGFVYTGTNTYSTKSLRRLGDRWNYDNDQNGQHDSFSLLASDADSVIDADDGSFSSHEDHERSLYPWIFRAETFPDPASIALTGGTYYSVARWWNGNPATYRRGTLDNNYAYTDGSVRRITQVPNAYDEREFIRVPIDQADNHARQLQIPRN